MKKQIASNEYFKVEADTSKNRLYTNFIGYWAEMSIMTDYITALNSGINMLKSNFTLVADLREFKTLPKELIPKQKEAMKILATSGMYKVAEIFPKSVIANMQLKNSAKTTNMPNQQFSPIQQGEIWLDAAVSKL